MRTREAVLADVNADLPPFDWAEGARAYLADFFAKYSRSQIEAFVLTKPLAAITPEDPAGSLAEVVGYLTNFANTLSLLQLPRGARVLDVACGPGWVSHWLTRLGYITVGLDISQEFLELAKKRLRDDPYIGLSADAIDGMFEVLDFERAPLPDRYKGVFDVAILESCLHHFVDPIAALSTIRESLSENGVILIIEGENRTGPIKDEYMQVMIDTHTLERPYPRAQLLEILGHAGLPKVEFLGAINGFFAQSAPASGALTEHLQAATEGANICLCAPSAAAIRRIVPTYGMAISAEVPDHPANPPPSTTSEDSLALQFAQRIRRTLPPWTHPPLRPFAKLFLKFSRRI